MSSTNKVLITGGTGFVGYWMQETQPCDGMFVYLDRHQYKLDFDNVQWTHIVHLAPIAPNRMIALAKYNHARLLYCSSGIVYHPENDTEYRRNKIKWERECLDSGIDCVIARLFTFYGERLDDGKAFTQFKRAAEADEPLHVWGDGSCMRSYMHGSELGAWMWAILLKGVSGEAYDVGSDEPVTMLELARSFSDNIVIENSRPDPMPVYLPVDTTKTKRLMI